MDTQALLDVLSVQSLIGRTGKGWDLGRGMLGASNTSAEDASKDGFVAKECLNCGVVLSGEFFASGCPNCGCKDTKVFGDKARRPVVSGSATGVAGGPLGFRFYVVGASQRNGSEKSKGEQQCHRKPS